MTGTEEPPEGSFEAAALWQLRVALKSTYAQRLQDLQDMIDLDAAGEASNPQLRAAVKRRAEPWPEGSPAQNSGQTPRASHLSPAPGTAQLKFTQS